MRTEEARLREQVAKLQEMLAEANEKIAWLESRDEEDPGERLVDDLMEVLHVGRVPARLCAVLYASTGRVANDMLRRVVWEDREMDNFNVIKVTACKLRRVLGCQESVETVWGVGYHMTDIGRSIVRFRLATLRREAPSDAAA